MRNTPEPPGDDAFQLEAPHIDHSSASANGGEIALMLVTERHWRRLSFDAAFYDRGNVGTLLFGGRRYARNRLPVRSLNPGRIPDDEDIFMPGNIEV